MQIYRAHFGQILGGILADRDISQKELAELIGIEPPNVSRWVNGVTFPDDAHFETLCQKLNIDKSVFLGRLPNKSDLIASIVADLGSLDEGELRTVRVTIDGALSLRARALARRKSTD